jgi:hypothetical protein
MAVREMVVTAMPSNSGLQPTRTVAFLCSNLRYHRFAVRAAEPLAVRWLDETRAVPGIRANREGRSQPFREAIILTMMLAALTAACGRREPGQPDLPDRDQWVTSISLGPDTQISYVCKTRNYLITEATKVKDLERRPTLRVGDEVEGMRLGAIRCSFHPKNAFNGGQYMWRGRWACQAGRSKDEVGNAVGPEGQKRFEYLFIAPVSLPE